ncbi:hypothetical protein [Azotobacter salinestris]|uniref:hypothetical protein n=1 Tax=Azotobacter salinestris TaxID=69964 RepID=UPI0032DE5C8F
MPTANEFKPFIDRFVNRSQFSDKLHFTMDDIKKAIEEQHKAKQQAEEVARQAALKRELIMRTWIDQGGPKSPVGLPLDANFPVVESGGQVKVQFRGGSMAIQGKDVVVAPERHVVVTFEGYALVVRQEKGDEVYGTLTTLVPSTGEKREHILRQVTLGPSDSHRVNHLSLVLYEGPPVDLQIGLSLFENDSGPRDEIRKRVASYVSDAISKTGDILTSTGVSTAAGVAIKSMEIEAVNGRSFLDIATGMLGGLIVDILGMGDDVYQPIFFIISHHEMMNAPPPQQLKCWNDPKILNYTHTFTAISSDDGDDKGQIATAFLIKPK